jgi:hypothetical protein
LDGLELARRMREDQAERGLDYLSAIPITPWTYKENLIYAVLIVSVFFS